MGKVPAFLGKRKHAAILIHIITFSNALSANLSLKTTKEKKNLRRGTNCVCVLLHHVLTKCTANLKAHDWGIMTQKRRKGRNRQTERVLQESKFPVSCHFHRPQTDHHYQPIRFLALYAFWTLIKTTYQNN